MGDGDERPTGVTNKRDDTVRTSSICVALRHIPVLTVIGIGTTTTLTTTVIVTAGGVMAIATVARATG